MVRHRTQTMMTLCSKIGRTSLAVVVSAAAADLPVQHVVIYKNGVALFERSGTVPAGEQARLEFRTADMNDILKSLTIVDSAGHRINSIQYDSNEELKHRLKDFPFSPATGELLSQFLDRLKGAAIELKTGERTLTGAILGARAIQTDQAGGTVQREQITLMTPSGELVTLDLGAVSSFQFLEARLQIQLKQYLQILNDSRSTEKRSLSIDSSGGTSQDLKISYVVPAAIWKSSYRLTLGDANSNIEGWAIVDNTTDEDWNKVRLSLVSGRPVSFISKLDTPRYGKRIVAELPEDAAAGPVVYGGGTGSGSGAGMGFLSAGLAQTEAVTVESSTPPVLARPNRQLMRSDGTHLGSGNSLSTESDAEFARLEPSAKLSSIRGAQSEAVGELFEYNFAQPITIKRNHSALIPFLQDGIAGRKLLIFDNSGSEHPVNAAELTNNTKKTLDGGPLTVYEHGTYSGEALMETLKAGDKRLLGYAVDYGTRITTAFDSGEQTVREIHGGEGVLRLRYSSRETRTYSITNVDSKPKTLVIQQEGISQYSVLSPKPTERTSSAYRFELPLEANKTRQFNVVQERLYENTTQITTATADFLVTLLQNKQLSDAGHKQLQALIDLKRRLADTTASLDGTRAQITELTADQTRVRQNIDSLNRVNGQEQQVRQYSAQLGTNEKELAQLRDTQKTLAQQKTALSSEVRKAIDTLEF